VAAKAARKIDKKTGTKTAVHYIVNARGQKTEAVLPISLYKRLLEQSEELEDIHHLDKAIKDRDFVPWEEAERQLGLLDRDAQAGNKRAGAN